MNTVVQSQKVSLSLLLKITIKSIIMKQKDLFIAAMLFAAIFMINACSGSAGKEMLNVDDILENPEMFVGKTISAEGVCSHVCSKSGMKLFLKNNDGSNTIRAESNSSLGKFSEDLIDKLILLKGTLIEERITESDLQEMEKEITKGIQASHGEGGEGCENEQNAEGVPAGSSEMERVHNFRTRIAERIVSEGKEYLSFYHIAADSYRIIEQ